jgi:hypothetical protein
MYVLGFGLPRARYWGGGWGRFLFLFLFLGVTPGQGAAFFERGAEWRWRPGTNEASRPVTAW